VKGRNGRIINPLNERIMKTRNGRIMKTRNGREKWENYENCK